MQYENNGRGEGEIWYDIKTYYQKNIYKKNLPRPSYLNNAKHTAKPTWRHPQPDIYADLCERFMALSHVRLTD